MNTTYLLNYLGHAIFLSIILVPSYLFIREIVVDLWESGKDRSFQKVVKDLAVNAAVFSAILLVSTILVVGLVFTITFLINYGQH